jgi:hypothetical protein
MADGSVARTYGIHTHRPSNLGDYSISQDKLLTAFRRVLARKKVLALVDDNGKSVKTTISFAENGTAHVTLGEVIFAFPHAGLLSSTGTERIAYLEQYLKELTVATNYAKQLRLTVKKGNISDDDFLSIIETLSTAQQSFIHVVRAKIRANDLTNSDLLPEDDKHWNNLIAPWNGSETLERFIVNECERERSARMRENPVQAFYTGSLSYCAPRLVPIDAFRLIDPDVTLQALQRASSLPDHFSTVGAFEICADLSSDGRFAALGTELLNGLLGNMEQLNSRCTFFAAAFALAQARIAQHQILRRNPPFWRRIVASAHASLVVRACGFENADEVFQWAMENSGKAFLFSVLLESADEPRWKPEWISSNYLIADAFGRIEAAINKIPEDKRPDAWRPITDKANDWIAQRRLEIACRFPAIGESARQKAPTMAETHAGRPVFEAFCREPSIDTLLMCGLAAYVAGVPSEILAPCSDLFARLQGEARRLDEEHTESALEILAFVALLSKDAKLADSVAAFCVEKSRESSGDNSALKIVARLIECAGANPNREDAMEVLARRLETVAYLAPSPASSDLYDSLRHLQNLDDNLANNLGRALAISRLGRDAS